VCASPASRLCSLDLYQTSNQFTGSSCNSLCAAATGFSGSCTGGRARYSGSTSSTTMNLTCNQVPWSSSGGASLYMLSCSCSVTALAPP
jgi:hypothetical protein